LRPADVVYAVGPFSGKVIMVRHQHLTHKVSGLTTAVLALVVLAACSSSGKATGSGSTAATTATTATTSGAPILVGGMSSLTNPAYSTPQNRDGMQAAIDSLNAAGGINGRPLKLDFCDTAFDRNKELSCARQLISDKVAAVLNPAVLADSSGVEYKLFQDANIPVIGGEGASPAETTSPTAYPLSSGLVGWVYGSVGALVRSGSKKISFLIASGATGPYEYSLAQDALKLVGLTSAGSVVDDTKADPTLDTAAAKLTGGGVDGIVLLISQVDIPLAVKAIRAADYTGKISSITALFSTPAIKAMGSSADGILLAGQLAFPSDTSNPAVTKFLADMSKYEPKATIDETTLFSWGAVQLFQKVAGPAKAYDGPAVLAAFVALKTPVDIGITAPYSTTATPEIPAAPRLLNFTVTYGSISGGDVKSDGTGFHDPYKELLSAASK
jgi:branched-chain amino acid transport system substrate-binding protein